MAVAGIIVSNASHLLSVLVLYQMTLLVAARIPSNRSLGIAFTSASLHIISPAGLFLSAPYAESSFSLMNFAGFYLYTYSRQAHDHRHENRRDIATALSGLLFGLASTLRSNGLLSGLVFCVDILECAVNYLSFGRFKQNARRLAFLTIAGGLVAVGFLFPQYQAFRDFCMGSEPERQPPWCFRRIPSIYSWVQQHYW